MTDPYGQPQYQVTQMPGMGWAMPMPEVGAQQLPPPKPGTLAAASWVWLAATVLSVFALPVLLLTNVDAFATEMFQQSQADPEPMSMAETRIASRVFGGMMIFGLLVSAVPFVIAAIKLHSGRNWARILLAVLGALGLGYHLLVVISSAFADNWAPGVTMTIAAVGLTITGIVLMFLPASNAYVRAVDR